MLKSKKKGIKEKLKSHMENISIDVLGLEKKVIENVSDYLWHLHTKHMYPLMYLDVRISKPENQIVVGMYCQDNLVKPIPSKELIVFFTGGIETPGLKEKVLQNVGNLLETYTHEYNISWEDLNVRISKPDYDVLVDVYAQDELIKRVPIKDLIKFFN